MTADHDDAIEIIAAVLRSVYNETPTARAPFLQASKVHEKAWARFERQIKQANEGDR